MALSRFIRPTIVTLFLSAVAFLIGRTQGQSAPPECTSRNPCQSCDFGTTNDDSCTIYSLKEMGHDAEFCKWIAETIPQVIEPGTWSRPETTERKRVVRYYAPRQILIVYHTPAVQARVEGFLKELKKSSTEGFSTVRGTAAKNPEVFHADFQERAPANHVPDQGSTYPVPPPAKQPKHLFHFIIRYEGAGIIDSNVADVIKAQLRKDSGKAEAPAPSSADEVRGKDEKESGPAKIDEKDVKRPSSSATPAAAEPVPPKSDKKESKAEPGNPRPLGYDTLPGTPSR
jgi:hypothetical protein